MTEKLPPEIKLTDEENETFTPAEKFDRWIELNPDRMQHLYNIYGKDKVDDTVAGLKRWLREKMNTKVVNSRKNWYMTIVKNVSKTRKYSYAGKSNKQREQPSKFTGQSGQRKMS